MRHMELLEMNKTKRNLLFIALATVFLCFYLHVAVILRMNNRW